MQSSDNGAMSDSKRHKLKKKKKKLLPEPAETNIQTNGQRNGLHGEQKYLQQLCTELGLTNNGTKQLEKQKPHEQPKTYAIQQCTKRGVKSAAEPNVIVFQEPCRSKKKAMVKNVDFLTVHMILVMKAEELYTVCFCVSERETEKWMKGWTDRGWERARGCERAREYICVCSR